MLGNRALQSDITVTSAECERLAELAKDYDAREGYRRLAEAWRRLADNHEFTEKMDAFLSYMKQ